MYCFTVFPLPPPRGPPGTESPQKAGGPQEWRAQGPQSPAPVDPKAQCRWPPEPSACGPSRPLVHGAWCLSKHPTKPRREILLSQHAPCSADGRGAIGGGHSTAIKGSVLSGESQEITNTQNTARHSTTDSKLHSTRIIDLLIKTLVKFGSTTTMRWMCRDDCYPF